MANFNRQPDDLQIPDTLVVSILVWLNAAFVNFVLKCVIYLVLPCAASPAADATSKA